MKDAYYIRSLAATVLVFSVVLAAAFAVVYYGGFVGFMAVTAPVFVVVGAFYGWFGLFCFPLKADGKADGGDRPSLAPRRHGVSPAPEGGKKTSQVKG